MRFLPHVSIVIVITVSMFTNSMLTSCTKIKNVYDTTTVTIHDTTTKTQYDTTVVRDSIYDLKNGLVLYLSFNGGTLTDSSVYENAVQGNNITKTTDRFGNANNAFLFDGQSSYIRVANSASLNPDNITMYAIVNINGFYTGPCAENQILLKGPNYQSYGLYGMGFGDANANCGTPNLNNETFSASYGDDVPLGSWASAGDSTPIVTNKWYYIIYTYDGINAKCYVNGTLKFSQQKKVVITDNNNDLLIGKSEDPNYPFYFKGVIDEVRIYNRALSAAEISQLVRLKY